MSLETTGREVFEVLGSARAMRWLKPDPVPAELIERLLWCATRATSPNNQQPWDFVVVQDAGVREAIGNLLAARLSATPRSLPEDVDPVVRRTLQGGMHLVANLGSAPVLIFICGRDVSLHGKVRRDYAYSAVHAAAQNLIIGARALGLGTAFTTLHESIEADLRELLRIPEDRFLAVTMPVGWPARPFGSLARRPIKEVAHFDGW